MIDVAVQGAVGRPDTILLLPSTLDSRGGTFNLGKSKSDLEWTIHRANQTPAPGGSYEVPSTLDSRGQQFNLSKPKSDIEWIMYNAAQIPGPGQYELKSPKVSI